MAPLSVEINGKQQTVNGATITRAFFPAAQVLPLLGRVPLSDDYDRQQSVCVLSEKLWRNSFGADPSVIGKPIKVNGANVVIVGVIPAFFDVPSNTGLWVPQAGAAR